MAEQRSDDYVKALENAISQFLKPFKDIPFPLVIKALTGYQVLSFISDEPGSKELLVALTAAATRAGQQAALQGIVSARPNEAGNRIEPFVLAALGEAGIQASRPQTKSGRGKSAGYPDIEANFQGKTFYLDCKTYARAGINSSLRSFFLSPSDNPKITKDAYHFLLAYELEGKIRAERQVFLPLNWRIYSLQELLVRVKHEFNASNRDIYGQLNPVAQGSLTNI